MSTRSLPPVAGSASISKTWSRAPITTWTPSCIYEYSVVGSTVTITLTSEYAAGGIVQHMGYVISGTTSDGIFLEVRDSDTAVGTDVDYYLDTPPTYSGSPRPAPATALGWDDNIALPLTNARTFTPGSSGGAILLKDPLWYAAKWGGFEEIPATANGLPDQLSEWDNNNDGNPDNYFLVTNALDLGQQLAAAFDEISRRVGFRFVGLGQRRLDLEPDACVPGEVQQRRLDRPAVLVPCTADRQRRDPGKRNRPRFWLPTGKRRLGFRMTPAASSSRGTPTPALRSRSAGPASAPRARGSCSLSATRRARRASTICVATAHRSGRVGEYRNRPSKLGDIVSSSPVFVGAPRAVYPDALHPSAPHSTFRNTRAVGPRWCTPAPTTACCMPSTA